VRVPAIRRLLADLITGLPLRSGDSVRVPADLDGRRIGSDVITPRPDLVILRRHFAQSCSVRLFSPGAAG